MTMHDAWSLDIFPLQWKNSLKHLSKIMNARLMKKNQSKEFQRIKHKIFTTVKNPPHIYIYIFDMYRLYSEGWGDID